MWRRDFMFSLGQCTQARLTRWIDTGAARDLSYVGVVLSFILAVYTLQSSRDKLEKFVRETVAETSIPGVVVAKVE
ncbi:hypothetical protein HAX54_021692 [Datura stramonium]|uniref:Uncharacterized protein n=1 Tax=Datura stramonium TaxID=4076 RepID=A0ABS8UTA7_DATST|nr:hypothetical protein [Datura stramonium]